jgi:hypothetical protein
VVWAVVILRAQATSPVGDHKRRADVSNQHLFAQLRPRAVRVVVLSNAQTKMCPRALDSYLLSIPSSRPACRRQNDGCVWNNWLHFETGSLNGKTNHFCKSAGAENSKRITIKPNDPAAVSVSARTFLFLFQFLFLLTVSVSVGFYSPSLCVAF